MEQEWGTDQARVGARRAEALARERGFTRDVGLREERLRVESHGLAGRVQMQAGDVDALRHGAAGRIAEDEQAVHRARVTDAVKLAAVQSGAQPDTGFERSAGAGTRRRGGGESWSHLSWP